MKKNTDIEKFTGIRFKFLCLLFLQASCVPLNDFRETKVYDQNLDGVYWSGDNKKISFIYANRASADPSNTTKNYFIGIIDIATNKTQIIKSFEKIGSVTLHGWTNDNKVVISKFSESKEQFSSIDLTGKTDQIFERPVSINTKRFLKPFSNSNNMLFLKDTYQKIPEMFFYDASVNEFLPVDFTLPAELLVPLPGGGVNSSEINFLDFCTCGGKNIIYFSNTKDTVLSSGQPINSGPGVYHYVASFDQENKKIINTHLFKSYAALPAKDSSVDGNTIFEFMGWPTSDEIVYAVGKFPSSPTSRPVQFKFYKYNLSTNQEEEMVLPNYGSQTAKGTFSSDGLKIIHIVGLRLFLYDNVKYQEKLLYDVNESLPKGEFYTAL